MPLTHRGLATSVRFLTGHAREGGEAALDDTVAAAADPHTTLVVYMGLGTLPALAAQLQAAGLPPDTPALAVERGTTPQQRAVYAPLEALVGAVGAAALRSPTLIVIGQVVSLAPGWRRWQATGASLDAGGARGSGYVEAAAAAAEAEAAVAAATGGGRGSPTAAPLQR